MSERFDELRGRFLSLQGELLNTLSGMRQALDEAEEENRRLRDEAQMTNVVVYTEPEAAEVLRMSQDTLARLRESEGLPHFRAGALVRYTNRHVAEITEMLSKPVRGKKRMRAA
jgi:hypothetical protein